MVINCAMISPYTIGNQNIPNMQVVHSQVYRVGTQNPKCSTIYLIYELYKCPFQRNNYGLEDHRSVQFWLSNPIHLPTTAVIFSINRCRVHCSWSKLPLRCHRLPRATSQHGDGGLEPALQYSYRWFLIDLYIFICNVNIGS